MFLSAHVSSHLSVHVSPHVCVCVCVCVCCSIPMTHIVMCDVLFVFACFHRTLCFEVSICQFVFQDSIMFAHEAIVVDSCGCWVLTMFVCFLGVFGCFVKCLRVFCECAVNAQ